MLIVVSPAKTLDFESPIDPALPATKPRFEGPGSPSEQLIRLLRRKSVADVAGLMNLSERLASLNVDRYAAWQPASDGAYARPAMFAFDGDVYGGLEARTLSPQQVQWAQEHLCILSGLYGVLRPMDLLQPYRLEMGTALNGPHGRNLYAFWGRRIADYLNERLAADSSPVLLNLASQEYFRAVDLKVLRARVIDFAFEDWKGGRYKVISFFAKRARGLMARYVIARRALHPDTLRDFSSEGYAFDEAASSPGRMVFRRRLA